MTVQLINHGKRARLTIGVIALNRLEQADSSPAHKISCTRIRVDISEIRGGRGL